MGASLAKKGWMLSTTFGILVKSKFSINALCFPGSNLNRKDKIALLFSDFGLLDLKIAYISMSNLTSFIKCSAGTWNYISIPSYVSKPT